MSSEVSDPSQEESPLTKVKIGGPSEHQTQIQSLQMQIDKISNIWSSKPTSPSKDFQDKTTDSFPSIKTTTLYVLLLKQLQKLNNQYDELEKAKRDLEEKTKLEKIEANKKKEQEIKTLTDDIAVKNKKIEELNATVNLLKSCNQFYTEEQTQETISVQSITKDHHLIQLEKMANNLHNLHTINQQLTKDIENDKVAKNLSALEKENKMLKEEVLQLKNKPIPKCTDCPGKEKAIEQLKSNIEQLTLQLKDASSKLGMQMSLLLKKDDELKNLQKLQKEFQMSAELEKNKLKTNMYQMERGNQELTLKLSKDKQIMDTIFERQQQFMDRVSKLEDSYNKCQNDNLQAINHMNAEFDKSLMRVKDQYYAKLKLIALESSIKQEDTLKKCNILIEQIKNARQMFIANYKAK